MRKISSIKQPRIKDDDPQNTLYTGDDLYDFACELHYAPSFQCPDISECIPPTLRAMLRAIPRVANHEGYAASAKNALKETMYLSEWFDGGAVWKEFIKQRPFVSRYPVVQFGGNIGDYLGYPPASMYFIEVRLNELGQFFLFKYPTAFVTIPYSLVNGHFSHYTNILPHNLTEVIDALLLLINNPDATLDQILDIIKGPDFPFGGEIIISKDDLRQIYETGQGDIDVMPLIEGSEDGVFISQYPPVIEEFGGEEDFDEYGFEKRCGGMFEKWGSKFHFKENVSQELLQKICKTPIFTRKIPVDFNFIVKDRVQWGKRSKLLQQKRRSCYSLMRQS